MSAVEWLEKQLQNCMKNYYPISGFIEQAKEMEKQQIIDAWNGGDYAYFYSKETGRDFADGTEYYNETYGSKGSDEHHEDNLDEISSQTEISDEDIKKAAHKHGYEEHSFYIAAVSSQKKQSWIEACKWYRKQLKLKK